MATPLKFCFVDISYWYHVKNFIYPKPVSRNISYPNSSGRENVVYGSSKSDETSLTIYFETDGNYINALRETSVANLKTRIDKINEKYIIGAIGPLTFENYSFENMLLRNIAFDGYPKKIISGPATYYIQPFTATFVQIFSR